MRAFARSFFTASVVALALALPANASEEDGINGEFGAYTQNIFRGLAQTNRQPGIQAGVDIPDPSGFYVRGWAANVSRFSDAAQEQGTGPVSVSLQMDLSFGFREQIIEGVSYDVGFVRHQYTGGYPVDFVKPHTNEIYGQVSAFGISLKLSNSISDTTFGVDNSKNSYYIDLTAEIPISEFLTVTLHAGKQKFSSANGGTSNDLYSYTDYKAEISAILMEGVTAGLGFTGTNSKSDVYKIDGKNISGTQFYGFIKKRF